MNKHPVELSKLLCVCWTGMTRRKRNILEFCSKRVFFQNFGMNQNEIIPNTEIEKCSIVS